MIAKEVTSDRTELKLRVMQVLVVIAYAAIWWAQWHVMAGGR